MKKLVFSIIFALAFLTGCEHLPKNSGTTVVEQEVKIDPKLLELCEALPPPSAKEVDAILIEDLVIIEKYGICRNKQADSVKLIKKLANIKE